MIREVNSPDQFMRLVVEALPELGSVVDKDVGQWTPSLVPGTTLYTAIDMHMAKTESGVLERSGIFDLVERGTLNAPAQVATWVATGGYESTPKTQATTTSRNHEGEARRWAAELVGYLESK